MTLLYGRSAGKGIIDGTSGEYVRTGAGMKNLWKMEIFLVSHYLVDQLKCLKIISSLLTLIQLLIIKGVVYIVS